jgi:hypothetical protein
MANYNSITKVTLSLTKRSSFFKNTPRSGISYPSTTKSQSVSGGGGRISSEEFPTIYGYL